MTRLYQNSLGGRLSALLGDNSGGTDTTMASEALAAMLEVVAPDEMLVTIDPDGEYGAPEYVKVTAHGAAATTATIERGLFGSTARAHRIGMHWVHGLLADDMADLPGTYVAQAVAETTAWVEPAVGTGWNIFGNGYEVPRYRKWMGMVTVQGLVLNNSGGALDSTDVIFNLPAGFRPRAVVGAPPFSGTSIEVTGAGDVRVNNSSPNGTFHWLTMVFVPDA